jgi:hypothetical protein
MLTGDNLFDMNQKYADVISIDAALDAISNWRRVKAA